MTAELLWWRSVSEATAPEDLVFPSEAPGRPIRQGNYLRRTLQAISS